MNQLLLSFFLLHSCVMPSFVDDDVILKSPRMVMPRKTPPPVTPTPEKEKAASPWLAMLQQLEKKGSLKENTDDITPEEKPATLIEAMDIECGDHEKALALVFLVYGDISSKVDKDEHLEIKYFKVSGGKLEEIASEPIASNEIDILQAQVEGRLPPFPAEKEVKDLRPDEYIRPHSGYIFRFKKSRIKSVIDASLSRMSSRQIPLSPKLDKSRSDRVANPTTFVGPKGGVYHYSSTGKKVYEKRKR